MGDNVWIVGDPEVTVVLGRLISQLTGLAADCSG
jgi:trehalose-6-phosphatase